MTYKLLVAEDETIERKVLCKTLNRYLGDLCRILEAKNGTEALEIARKEQPHIAILDISMPGITGLDVARRIREDNGQCVILFLTAFDNFSYAQQAISVRALDYILKPYNEQELLSSVESAIQVYDRMCQCGLIRETASRPRELPQQPADREEVRLSYVRAKIQAYIAENYHRDISMQDVAQAMNYSEAYFCKLFKECFQVNFSAYLNEYRIEKAKKLLADTNGGIREISAACGYSDPNYFARAFKRITGVTPSDYRISAPHA